tara:strand:- start:338 stop:859 length:522 start_codon:yes stop_codon:yes gene_type:complete
MLDLPVLVVVIAMGLREKTKSGSPFFPYPKFFLGLVEYRSNIMSMSDPIADFLTRIRNAQMARLPNISCPSSKTKTAISQVLQNEGFIGSYNVSDEDGKAVINIELRYFQGKPVIEEIRRVSRPGLRAYKGAQNIPKNRAGLGVAILSTNQGLMTDRQAEAAGIGGEVLCTVF